MNDAAADETAEDTASDMDTSDSAEADEDAQDEPVKDAAADETAEDTASDADTSDSAEADEGVQDEPAEDTAADETADGQSDVPTDEAADGQSDVPADETPDDQSNIPADEATDDQSEVPADEAVDNQGDVPADEVDTAQLKNSKNDSPEYRMDNLDNPDVSSDSFNSLSDYMNAHNYGPDDFATYSQDPEWRILHREAFPDYELPPLTQENAYNQLSDYMNTHNYGPDDFAVYSQDSIWRELHSAAFPDDELPPLNDARQEQKKPAIASSGGGNPPPPSGSGGDDGNHPNPPDGSDGWVCPVCGKNPCVCDTGNNEGSDTPPPPDDPDKVLRRKRNEFDLLKSGNDAINQRLEAKADDYRDKGLSEEEIADRLAADKWEYQKEFLDDAFPGEDISPNVFNGFNEHGAKDRIDEMEKSPLLREIFTGKKNEESDLGQDVVSDARASEYNKTLKDFCENNGYVKNADFSDFDPHVAYDFAKSVVDAKKDFPDLDVNYLGSIGHQVKGLHDTVETAQFDFYKQNGIDEGLAQQMAKQYADDFISNSKLDDTEGTYAWSLRAGNPSLDKYDGVAVNNDYAKDYTKFKSEKQADEIARWAPVGCGSPKAVADHELGHEIDNLLGASKDSVINDLYSSMMKDDKAESVLSGYSKKNVKEFIAEAYSEYRNNPNPREVSRAVYNRLIELRDQKPLSRRLI